MFEKIKERWADILDGVREGKELSEELKAYFGKD